MSSIITGIITALLLMAVSLVQLSCQSSTKPSVLVIAVDDLSVFDILCNDEDSENPHSGFEILCKESVRFTHAFTPSVMSAPTLASILTGLYPFQHKVHNNGAPGLDASFVTVAERALTEKYHTAFFSGGPPIWRKSGLNQGFEIFDDNTIPSRQALYRPFSSTSKALTQWTRQEIGNAGFFATIYVPDLVFTNTVTLNELGEARNLSHESQLDELDSNLFALFSELKSQHRWHNTTIILTGLNGHTVDDRPGELTSSNLHTENTQVALFIKPAQKVRDEALRWKVDRNVTLTDLGDTLFELIGAKDEPHKRSEAFPVTSLVPTLRETQPASEDTRLLLLESDWPQWRGFSNRRYGILNGHMLYLYDKTPQIFNTLTDRFETSPLRNGELPVADRQRIALALEEAEAEPWQGIGHEVVSKYGPGFFRWMRPDQKAPLLNDLKHKVSVKKPDGEVLHWAALLAFDLKDWNTLKNLGIKADDTLWQFVADKNGANVGPTSHFLFGSDSCLRLLDMPKLDSAELKKCDDSLFLDFIDWQRAETRSLSREIQKRKFERAYLNALIDQDIQKAALATGMNWDLSSKMTLSPLRIDLVLALPDYQKPRNALIKALQNSKAWEFED